LIIYAAGYLEDSGPDNYFILENNTSILPEWAEEAEAVDNDRLIVPKSSTDNHNDRLDLVPIPNPTESEVTLQVRNIPYHLTKDHVEESLSKYGYHVTFSNI